MDALVVRQQVRQFCEKTAHVGGEPHCFAPWYLHQKFGLAETQAMQQSSDGNYDFGIDAFQLVKESDGRPSTLVLVQAKYTGSLQQIIGGFRDLERALPEVARSLTAIGTEEPVQNKVLVNLRAALNRLDAAARGRLAVDFEVPHLSEEDEAILAVRFREVMNRLDEAVREKLDEHTCRIRQFGPRDLGPQQVVVAPPEEVALRIDGVHEFPAGERTRMFSGLVRLADLIDLYRARRDDLFSRNVRYYLQSKTNTEKGPAGKMRATLKQMCVDATLEPERFAVFHNGVTMFSRRVRKVDEQIRVRDPYVLNGCQTIKNAFLFRFDGNLKSKIKDDRWHVVWHDGGEVANHDDSNDGALRPYRRRGSLDEVERFHWYERAKEISVASAGSCAEGSCAMKRLGWFVSVVLSVLIWSELFAAPATADDRDACNKGSAAGDAAIAACTRFIASGTLKGANLSATFNRRGLAYNSQGDLDHAIADYSEAIRLNRKFAIAFTDRGGAYKAKGDLDHAIADYSEALQLDPNDTFALNGRGTAYDDKGDYDRAVAD
jgi:hypothetical protein